MIDKLLELLLPVFIARNEVRILAPLRALDSKQDKQTAQAPSVLSTYTQKDELK